jgi:hypothetical protein
MLNQSMRRAVQLFSMLVLLVGSTAAQAQVFSLVAGSGGQVAIGNGLPLPIQIIPPTQGTGTVLPALLIQAVPFTQGLTIVSNGAGDISVPTAVLSRIATGIAFQPTLASNPAVFQVNTAIDYAWPSAAATFSHGGSPVGLKAGITSVFVGTGPAAGNVTYTNANLGASFGGAALFATGPGTGTAGGAILGSPVTVYINAFGQSPGPSRSAAIVGATASGLQWGATTSAATITTMVAPADPGWAGHPAFGGSISIGPGGTVIASVQCVSPCLGLNNNVLGDKGFPWTTGQAVLSAFGAAPPEVFTITGGDTRPGGVGPGNIQMVTGTVSDRAASGPNANRGWVSLTLPEPAAMLGVTGAFLMLGLCNTVVRRRSR